MQAATQTPQPMKTLYWEGKVNAGPVVPMSDEERALRVKLAAAYRIFNMLGWVELIFNHITVRVPGPEKWFLINPFGLHYSEVTASNLVLIDVEGNAVRPSAWPVNRAGFVIHSAIHTDIPNAHCVMHTHTTTGIAVASLAGGISPHNFYGAQLYGQVAYHDFEGVTVNAEEHPRLITSIGDKRSVVLRNHGLLTLGETIEEAFFRLYSMQRACDVQIAAASAGAVNPVNQDVLDLSVKRSGALEPRLSADVFNAMQRLVDHKDPSYRQ
jgi:ribulose-5-phosphate 4-epimerase/fuculose-1-phosphate aldolase